MTYNIVEVVPGKYAIRRRTYWQELFNTGGAYKDLLDLDYWTESDVRFRQSRYLSADLEHLQNLLTILKTKPKVIA